MRVFTIGAAICVLVLLVLALAVARWLHQVARAAVAARGLP